MAGNRPGGYVPEHLDLLGKVGAIVLAQHESLRLSEEVGYGCCINQPPPTLENLVHDIRQPLSTISACSYYLSLALRGADNMIQIQLDRIHHQIQRADALLTGAVQRIQSERKPEEITGEESRSSTNRVMAGGTY